MSGPLEERLPSLDAALARSAALHHHLCPRQVLGARMGLYAGALLGLDLPRADKRLFTFVETDGCFADGVAAATGCWLGRRTLRLIDYGMVAATFVDTQSEQAIRVWPHPLARQQAAAYVPAAQSRWHAQLAAYQSLPTATLLCARPVVLTVSLAAIISRAGARVNCTVCGEEIINEREALLDGQPFCRGCADGSYYAPAATMNVGRRSDQDAAVLTPT